MNGALIRVGIDGTPRYGGWNAPVNETGRFVFVPITDSSYNPSDSYVPGGKRTYDEVRPVLRRFGVECRQPEHQAFTLPAPLRDKAMHLDPDFQKLTYGDSPKRGSCFIGSSEMNFAAFYSSLRSLQNGKLVYALIGIFFLAGSPRRVDQIPAGEALNNAHTRWSRLRPGDIVIQGEREKSGLFEKCIEIGEWRRNAYRVKECLLTEWGGLSVKDGWIQRGGVPPRFTCGGRFLDWLHKQKPRVIRAQYQAPYRAEFLCQKTSDT